MKKIYVILLSLLAVYGVSSAQSKQPKDVDIRNFIQKYDDAWNKKDSVTVERMFAPEYVYFSSIGSITSRKSTLEMLLSPKYKVESAERTELKVHLTGNTAVVSSRWKGPGSYNDQEFRDDQRCSLVLAREKKDWVVLSEHCTQIVTP